jgi:UDP-2-acetamido-3-amino-2,3-dideoxy-glucuronate N-acetyltransferase
MSDESSSCIDVIALVDPGAHVGAGTRICSFSHVYADAVIGRDCNINEHVLVENQVCIGDRVTINSGVQVWDGVTLEDDVFVGPNATFANAPLPGSQQCQQDFLKTIVCAGASIGANATILPGITIGTHAMIGAGAVVTQDVPSYAIVVGNPARLLRQGTCKTAFRY